MRLFGYGNVYISIISSGQEYIIDTFGREMEDHSVKTISDALIISEQHVIVDLTEESSQSYFVREANLSTPKTEELTDSQSILPTPTRKLRNLNEITRKQWSKTRKRPKTGEATETNK